MGDPEDCCLVCPQFWPLFGESGNEDGRHPGEAFQPQLDVCDRQLAVSPAGHLATVGCWGVFHPFVRFQFGHFNKFQVKNAIKSTSPHTLSKVAGKSKQSHSSSLKGATTRPAHAIRLRYQITLSNVHHYTACAKCIYTRV